ncbi:MAG: helix-turn-helix domain-containing protein [Halobacteria archaeon]|nr:helix-turn-helix domain-containing protein [Halobacteria archaeon]
MTDSDPVSRAIKQLEEMGLSTYAARTFVGLTGIGKGTAKEISRVSEVPRTRVYDAVDELREWGLVDVQNSNPQEFWCVSADTAGRVFQQKYEQNVNMLTDALDEISTDTRIEEQRGVWTVTGKSSVTDRVKEFIDSAENEVIYMTVEELLTDEVVESLENASERSIDIKIAGISENVENDIREVASETETFESIWNGSDTPAARLLLVDRKRTLVSVLTNEEHEDDELQSETAIWGLGETNSLVVVVQALFMWRLDDMGG